MKYIPIKCQCAAKGCLYYAGKVGEDDVLRYTRRHHGKQHPAEVHVPGLFRVLSERQTGAADQSKS
jgi:hypothetical protein